MAEIERLVVGPLQTNCYILKDGDELAVIDPGGDPDHIMKKVEELGGTVKYVIDTHGHIDHVAANKKILDATGAELLVHEDDAAMLTEPELGLGMMIGVTPDAVTPDRTLVEGDEVKVGETVMKVYHTPGHTPGGMCLVTKEFAFTGDTLFVDSIGRTDFPGGSNAQMKASLDRLRAILGQETRIYPGHNEPGTFGRALLVNPFLGSIWPA